MLEILKFPDERLHTVSKSIEQYNEELHDLLDQMAETMYAANGVGLAAPQVGHFIRCFVIDLGPQKEGEASRLYEFINPNIVKGSGKIVFEEGCLSVPGIAEEVTRKEKVSVEFQDRVGSPKTLEAEGLLAVAIQHEKDHLDGILFIERLSPLKRRLVKRKLNKVVTL